MSFNANKKIAKLQRSWAAIAFRDEKYNRARSKHVRNKQLKKEYSQEANIAHYWGMRRLKRAKHFSQ